jgi:NADH-quinone oxidoreductase subunit L
VIDLAILTLLMPLGCFLLLALCWPLRHNGIAAARLSAAVAVLSAITAAILLAEVMSTGGPPQLLDIPWLVHRGATMASLGIRVDGISASMLVVVTAVAAAVQVYSLGYMAEEPRPAQGRYFLWHSLFIVAMGGLVLSANLLQLFACWELVGLCSYLLIGFYWKKPSAGRAAVKAFWMTKMADMGLLLGLVVLYATTGGFSWETPVPAAWATAVPALLFIGVMGKSAQVPLHVWLPDAMEGPTPVSALLHAATMVAAGVFLLVRAYPLYEAAPDLLVAMTWIGAITAFVAAATAVVQDDIKKVLAYSTCSQLGFMVCGLGSGAWVGGYFHLTTHAFFKALLFLGAGAAIHAVNSNRIQDMGGLWRTTRRDALVFIIGAAALAGVPGLAGFFSKDLLLEEVFHAGHLVPLALLLISAGLTAFYMTRVVVIAFFGTPSKGAEHAHAAPWTMGLPTLLLAVPALGAGFLGGTFAELWGAEYHFAITPVGIAATAAGLTGIGLGVVRYGTKSWAGDPLAAVRGFILSGPIDGLWVGGYRRALLPVSQAIGWVDRFIVDGLMNLFGWGALRLGTALRPLQSGLAQDAVMAVVIGVLLFLAFGALGAA